MSADPDVLEKAAAGDLLAFAQLRRWPSARLAAVTGPPLVIEAIAVARVLKSLEDGEDLGLIRDWAVMARSGVITAADGRQVLVTTDWPDDVDDAIAAALMRMSELGDLIDGDISVSESRRLQAALRG